MIVKSQLREPQHQAYSSLIHNFGLFSKICVRAICYWVQLYVLLYTTNVILQRLENIPETCPPFLLFLSHPSLSLGVVGMIPASVADHNRLQIQMGEFINLSLLGHGWKKENNWSSEWGARVYLWLRLIDWHRRILQFSFQVTRTNFLHSCSF
jgi:hypothetical protein